VKTDGPVSGETGRSRDGRLKNCGKDELHVEASRFASSASRERLFLAYLQSRSTDLDDSENDRFQFLALWRCLCREAEERRTGASTGDPINPPALFRWLLTTPPERDGSVPPWRTRIRQGDEDAAAAIIKGPRRPTESFAKEVAAARPKSPPTIPSINEAARHWQKRLKEREENRGP